MLSVPVNTLRMYTRSWIDQYFDFSEHVKMTCKIAFFRIWGIAKIRRYLSHDTAKQGG